MLNREFSNTIANMLPLDKLRDLGRELAEQYAQAKPYPHIVIDNFFNPELLDAILSEFPRPDAIKWQE